MAKRRDITSQRFGRLVAVKLSDETNSRGERYWECACDCGNVTFAMLSDLTSEKKQSCGCRKHELTISRNQRTKRIDPIKRFSERYIISDSGCWEWSGTVDNSGYGLISINSKQIKAHRFSWELYHGKIPHNESYHGVMVCHHCDNPSCVNPDHLFLGLAADNVKDMFRKNRNRCISGEAHWSRTRPDSVRRGEAASQAILKASDIIAIRESEEPKSVLASRFGVSIANICVIQKRITWRHI